MEYDQSGSFYELKLRRSLVLEWMNEVKKKKRLLILESWSITNDDRYERASLSNERSEENVLRIIFKKERKSEYDE